MTKQIRFATIGSNFIVDSFLRGAGMDPRFAHTAVYSRSRERALEFSAKHGGGHLIFTSLKELACSPDVDAVYIATPNVCHAPQAILMMEHGKHVLCEKPLAPTPEEVVQMTESARSNGVLLMEAMKTTLLPNFLHIREVLPQIGRVRRCTASFCQYSSRFKAFLEGGPVANVFNPAMGGGALRDLGVYGIAPIVHLFGTPWEGEFSREKLMRAVHVLPTMARGIDIQGSLIMDYPGMQAIVYYSKACDGAFGMEILGEEGLISIQKTSTMLAPVLKLRSGVGDADKRGASDEAVPLDRPTVDFMYYELKEFLDCLAEGRSESAENTLQRSLDVARIVSAAKGISSCGPMPSSPPVR